MSSVAELARPTRVSGSIARARKARATGTAWMCASSKGKGANQLLPQDCTKRSLGRFHAGKYWNFPSKTHVTEIPTSSPLTKAGTTEKPADTLLHGPQVLSLP